MNVKDSHIYVRQTICHGVNTLGREKMKMSSLKVHKHEIFFNFFLPKSNPYMALVKHTSIWAYKERISAHAQPAVKCELFYMYKLCWAYAECLKVEYLGRIEYDFQKSRVTGPWDHMVSVSAKKVKKIFMLVYLSAFLCGSGCSWRSGIAGPPPSCPDYVLTHSLIQCLKVNNKIAHSFLNHDVQYWYCTRKIFLFLNAKFFTFY